MRLSYEPPFLLLLLLLAAGLVWMYVGRGDRKVFTAQLLAVALKTLAFSALVSSLSMLYRAPLAWVNLQGLFLLVGVAYVLFGWWYWHGRHLPELDHRAIWSWELPRALVVWALAATALLGGLLAKQRYLGGGVEVGAGAGAMVAVTLANLVFLFPAVYLLAYRNWLRIPIVVKYREPWVLPVDRDAPVIEPSADALRLFLNVPLREQDERTVSFDVRVPRRVSLGEAFHHLLYDNNIRERSHHRIEVAYQNKADYVYGWQLFRRRRRWWGQTRDYVGMDVPVRETGLQSGEYLFAERVRRWEDKP